MSETANIAFSAFAPPKGGTLVAFVGADLKAGVEATALLAPVAATIAAAAETAAFKGKATDRARHPRPRRPRGFAPPRRRRRAGQGRQADGLRPARRFRRRQAGQVEGGDGALRIAGGGVGRGRGGRVRARRAAAASTSSTNTSRRSRTADENGDETDRPRHRRRRSGVGPRRLRRARKRRRRRRDSRATSSTSRRTCCFPKPSPSAPRSCASSASTSKCSTKRRWRSSAWARCSPSGAARPAKVGWWRCAGAARRSKKAAPIAFVGKGVCFDTGGISIKPGAGHGGHEGRHGGRGLRRRPRSTRWRGARPRSTPSASSAWSRTCPTDRPTVPATSSPPMSGQTIEVVNTDAEGRLVLADALWWTKENVKPKLIVDLATLTGAIIVALGNEHAGLFSNDDELAERLIAAGKATGEAVWRMPLGAGLRQADRFQVRRHEEHRRAPRRLDHRRAIPQTLRRRHALGASRHRGHRDGLAGQRNQYILGIGLWRPAARPLDRRATTRIIRRGFRARRLDDAVCPGSRVLRARRWFARRPRPRRLPGCDAFLDKLRDEARDLGVEFRHALIVTRAHSENSVFDITTRAEVDGALTCRDDKLLRFEAHVSEPATARALERVRKLETRLAARRARLGRGQGQVDGRGHGRRREGVSRGLEGARRRLYRRQDRGARSRRRRPRPHLHRGRPRLHHRGRRAHERGDARIPLPSSRTPAHRPGACRFAGARRSPKGERVVVQARLGGRGRGAQRAALDLSRTRVFCRTARSATASRRRSRSI